MKKYILLIIGFIAFFSCLFISLICQETFNQNKYLLKNDNDTILTSLGNISYNLSSVFIGEPIILNFTLESSNDIWNFDFYFIVKSTDEHIQNIHFDEKNKSTDNNIIHFENPGYYIPALKINNMEYKKNKFFVYSYEYKASEKNEISQRNLMNTQLWISTGLTLLMICISINTLILPSYLKNKKIIYSYKDTDWM